MTPECAIDIGMPIVPIFEPMGDIVPAEFAYTPKQREWWLRVYNYQCAFPKETEDGAIEPCGRTEHLEAHHIQPDGWTRTQEPWQDPNDTDGIILCRAHHNGTIHPDIGEARDNYWQDQDSFKKALEEHKRKAQEGEVFWNNDYDDMLSAVSNEAVQRYLQDHPYDTYPEDKSWKKKTHPKKPHWTDGWFEGSDD